MSRKTVRVGVLYPDHLNIYADRGNLLFLRKRCEWRGIDFELLPYGFGSDISSTDFDLLYIGGGQDRDQALCAEDLGKQKAGVIRTWFEDGRPLLAVCGGFQLLGSHYEASNQRITGVGAADLQTEAGRDRLIGPIAIQTDLGGPAQGVLAGFENHAGRTQLGSSAAPLGTVIKGNGNDGSSGLEGVRNGFAVGTYLHGPLLPKNWWLADWLIAACAGLDWDELPVLADDLERAAHESALRAAGVSG